MATRCARLRRDEALQASAKRPTEGRLPLKVGPWLPILPWLVVTASCEAPAGDGLTVPDDRPAVVAHAEQRWAAGGTEERGGLVLEPPVWAAAIAPDGSVALVDRSSSVTLVDRDGRLANSLGRAGGGPGEFRDPRGVGFTPDTILWVTDVASGRITSFTRNGEVLDTRNQPLEPVPESPWSARGAQVLEGESVLGSASGSEEAVRGDLLPLPVVIWDSAGALQVVDWVERAAPSGRRIPTDRGLPVSGSQPIQGGPVVGAERLGRWFFVLDRAPAEGPEAHMRITRYTPTGAQLDRLTIPYEPVPLDDEIMARLEDAASNIARQLPPAAGRVRAADVMEATWIPTHLPPVQQVLADEEGFWLRREQFKRAGTWDRYTLEGRWLARLDLPDRFRGLAGTARTLVGVSVDSLGTPVLQQFDVEFEEEPDGEG